MKTREYIDSIARDFAAIYSGRGTAGRLVLRENKRTGNILLSCHGRGAMKVLVLKFVPAGNGQYSDAIVASPARD